MMSDRRWSSAVGAASSSAAVRKVVLLLSFLLCSSCERAAAQNQVICPRVESSNTSITIDTYDPVDRFDELSGLALSKQYVSDLGNPVLYGMADIGGSNRLGIWDSVTGQRLVSLQLEEANNDWESMAFGSCGNKEGTCIYIGDTGDNEARTSVGEKSQRQQAYRILKIMEPNWKMYTDSSVLPSSELEILEFNYMDPSSPSVNADSESMFLDHTGWGEGKAIGDLYVITKWDNLARQNMPRVFYIPVSAWGTGTYSPVAISNGNALLGGRWTRADMTYDGTLIAVGDVNVTNIFARCPGASVDEAMAGAIPCYTWVNPVAGQMESFAWSPDGTKNIQIAEGSKQPMAWTTMTYDPANTVSCSGTVSNATVPSPTNATAPSPTPGSPSQPNNNALTPTTVPSLSPSATPDKKNDKDSTPSPTRTVSLSPSETPSKMNDTNSTSAPVKSIPPTFSSAPAAAELVTDSPSLRPAMGPESMPEGDASPPTSGSLSRLAGLSMALVVGILSSSTLLFSA